MNGEPTQAAGRRRVLARRRGRHRDIGLERADTAAAVAGGCCCGGQSEAVNVGIQRQFNRLGAGLGKAAVSDMQQLDVACFGQDDIHVAQTDAAHGIGPHGIERLAKTAEDRRQNLVRIDQPFRIAQGGAPVTGPGRKVGGDDACIDDSGAGQAHVSGQERNQANTEPHRPGLDHRPAGRCPDADVADAKGEETPAVECQAGRPESNGDIDAGHPLDGPLGDASEAFRTDARRADEIDGTGEDGQQQRKGDDQAKQDAPAAPEPRLSQRRHDTGRWHRAQISDFVAPELNLFVRLLLIHPFSVRTRSWRIPARPYIGSACGVTSNRRPDMADPDASGTLDAGDMAPDFDLPRDGGGTISLASLRGRPVVLYFYPQDDTTGCTSEAIAFSHLLPDFEKAGAAVIGLSPDSAKKHDKFKAKHGLTVSLAADEERKAIETYHLWVEKQMYGRRYMGVERSTFLIDPDGRIARIWHKVRVKGHAEEVLEAVRALAKERSAGN